MNKLNELPDLYTISDLKSLRVLSDSLHRQIFEVLITQSLSAKQIGEKLGINSTKLYYHLKLMEKAGIIKVENTQIVSGIIEKSYRAVARRLQIDPSLLTSDSDSGKENINQVLLSTLETTKKDIDRSLHAHYAELEQDSHVIIVSRQLCYLSDEQANEFCEKLNSLIKDFEGKNTNSSDMQSFSLMVVFYPNYYFES
jgi:predicted ArsR family transcriptional regulator